MVEKVCLGRQEGGQRNPSASKDQFCWLTGQIHSSVSPNAKDTAQIHASHFTGDSGASGAEEAVLYNLGPHRSDTSLPTDAGHSVFSSGLTISFPSLLDSRCRFISAAPQGQRLGQKWASTAGVHTSLLFTKVSVPYPTMPTLAHPGICPVSKSSPEFGAL